MADGQVCILSDVCIDYLMKQDFKLYITCDGSREDRVDWIAERDDLSLSASDPVRLAALYLIHDDWISNIEVPKYESLF